MTLPNFLIIGAGRSGTTSLWHYLRQHPQIFMSDIKETNFFAYNGEQDAHRFTIWTLDAYARYPIRTLDAYATLFSAAAGERAIGEASPAYLVRVPAADRIRQRLPGVKLIAQLRDPSEAAYASYLGGVDIGGERRDFATVIREYRAAIEQGTEIPGRVYLPHGFYYRHLTRFLERFPRDRLFISLYDDFERDPMIVLRQIFRFLEVEEDFSPNTSKRHNATGIPRSKLLHAVTRPHALSRATKWLPHPIRRFVLAFGSAIRRRNVVKPALATELRRELVALYRDDVSALQDLIRRDLTPWLT